MWFVVIGAVALCPTLSSALRQVESLDHGWRFKKEEQRLQQCDNKTFPDPLPGRCTGLASQGRPEDGGPGSASACREACCSDASCNAWQWCGPNSTCESPNTCFKGLIDVSNCSSEGHWEGEGDSSRKPEALPLPGHRCNASQCLINFDDSSWPLVTVPHDFVVSGSFNRRADKSHGYLPYGVAWYRRKLCLPDAAAISTGSKHSWLEFEGVMVKSKVWLNGAFLGAHFSGYTPKLLDISPAPLKPDCSNLLAVYVDATAPDGWWYDGGGIYRHVWLTTVSPVHIVPWGLYAPAAVVGQVHGYHADAEVYPKVELANLFATQKSVRIVCVIKDQAGRFVMDQELSTWLAAGDTIEVPLKTMRLEGASLWSPHSPALYQMTVQLWSSDPHSRNTQPDDEVTSSFGVRNVSWSPDAGFFINGISTKILGTANHQDYAVLGVAVPDHLQAHRLRKLQQFGANAWRTAHNPPNEALLAAADRLGILVWDENHRNGQDSEMEVLIKRDRNHPSIVIWSICNERLCDTIDARGDAKRLKDMAHRLDPQMGRVVSANHNPFNGRAAPMDLMGFDYGPEMYDKWHAEAPTVPAISSETSSAYSDRGLVFNNRLRGHVRDYDTEHPSWGQTAEVAWQAILSRPFVAGGFTWTGWDYRGEPTPYGWPDVNSHFGILDIASFWKHRAHWYLACWTPVSDAKVLHLLPHWNWKSEASDCGCSAYHVDVWAYSNLEEVELIHPNGTSLGRQNASQCSHVEWPSVPYMPGTLSARGYVGGKVVKTSEVRTTGSPVALRIGIIDGVGAEGVVANGQDVGLVSVEVVDDKGDVVPTASNIITVSAKSGAVILGTANGDPASLAPNDSPDRPAFGGRLMAVVRPLPGATRAKIVAESKHLAAATLELKVLSGPATVLV